MLTAFAVVLATLVVQGLTLAPLVRLLKLDGEDGLAAELAGHAPISPPRHSQRWKARPARSRSLALWIRDDARRRHDARATRAALETKRQLGLAAIRRQRERLDELRNEQRVGADAFLILQEELDFDEVALTARTSGGSRRVECGKALIALCH